eukprot:927126-Prymnesium_polylepis.5
MSLRAAVGCAIRHGLSVEAVAEDGQVGTEIRRRCWATTHGPTKVIKQRQSAIARGPPMLCAA